MSDERKPGDPADKAADGAFGGVQSHRAGYGDDKLARLIGWLRSYPHATLASGEGAVLLAEIDRLRQRAERAERILAALREPSFEVAKAAAELITRTNKNFPSRAIRAAVAAAEQEVGSE